MVKRLPNIVALSGGHAAGKDYMAERIVKTGQRVVFCPSPTRRFYDEYGIRNEVQALKRMGPAELAKFQHFLSDAFSHWLDEQFRLARLARDTLFIIGKTPVEYVAYQNVVLDPDHHGRHAAEAKLHRHLRSFVTNKVSVFHLGWPPPWQASSSGDGFRDTNARKNDLHAAELERLWKVAMEKNPDLRMRYVPVSSFNIEDRVRLVLDAYQNSGLFAPAGHRGG